MIDSPLPPGVTGFLGHHPAPRIPIKDFKAACYQFAQRLGGEVGLADEANQGRNYHAVGLKLKGHQLSALCNAVHPIVCFVPAGAYGFTTLEFQAPDEVLVAASALGRFHPAAIDYLLCDPLPRLLVELLPEERHQIEFWRSRGMIERLGDIIFNAWD